MRTQQQSPRVQKNQFVSLVNRFGITYEGVVKYFHKHGFAITTLDGQEVRKYDADSFRVITHNAASEQFIRERRAAV